jgi:hypothetical protein
MGYHRDASLDFRDFERRNQIGAVRLSTLTQRKQREKYPAM